MNTEPRYADVDSILVSLNSGTPFSVLLTTTDGSTYELHGVRIFAWLRGWWRRCEALRTTHRSTSLQTSKGSVRNDRQAHFAWEK